jgi:hypothetical protein
MFTGLAMLIHGCKITAVGKVDYLASAVFPPLIAACPAVLMLTFASWYLDLQTWPRLIMATALYTAMYAAACWVVLKPHQTVT